MLVPLYILGWDPKYGWGGFHNYDAKCKKNSASLKDFDILVIINRPEFCAQNLRDGLYSNQTIV